MKPHMKNGPSTTGREAQPEDVHVGERLRQRWRQVGISQVALAEMVGVKWQQMRKYETAQNRISASRLWDIAKALGVPVDYFFEGLKPGEKRASDDLLARRETYELLMGWNGMSESNRKALLEVLRTWPK